MDAEASQRGAVIRTIGAVLVAAAAIVASVILTKNRQVEAEAATRESGPVTGQTPGISLDALRAAGL